jgi:hypothetical protein
LNDGWRPVRGFAFALHQISIVISPAAISITNAGISLHGTPAHLKSAKASAVVVLIPVSKASANIIEDCPQCLNCSKGRYARNYRLIRHEREKEIKFKQIL